MLSYVAYINSWIMFNSLCVVLLNVRLKFFCYITSNLNVSYPHPKYIIIIIIIIKKANSPLLFGGQWIQKKETNQTIGSGLGDSAGCCHKQLPPLVAKHFNWEFIIIISFSVRLNAFPDLLESRWVRSFLNPIRFILHFALPPTSTLRKRLL